MDCALRMCLRQYNPVHAQPASHEAPRHVEQAPTQVRLLEVPNISRSVTEHVEKRSLHNVSLPNVLISIHQTSVVSQAGFITTIARSFITSAAQNSNKTNVMSQQYQATK